MLRVPQPMPYPQSNPDQRVRDLYPIPVDVSVWPGRERRTRTKRNPEGTLLQTAPNDETDYDTHSDHQPGASVQPSAPSADYPHSPDFTRPSFTPQIHSCSPSPQSGSSSSPGVYPPPEATKSQDALGKFLIAYVQQGIDFCNARDHANPCLRNSMHPSFSGHIDSLVIHGRDEYLRAHRSLYDIFPDLSLETINPSIDIDDRRGRAKVWMTFRVHGYIGNVERFSVNVFDLQRIAGKWASIRHRAVSGLENFDDFTPCASRHDEDEESDAQNPGHSIDIRSPSTLAPINPRPAEC